MQADLYTLSYFSRNNIERNGGDLRTEVQKILACARRNNAQLGITGALLFTANSFIQILEGPQDVVKATFERIKDDPRHRDISLLHFDPLAQRTFPIWSMAFAGSLDPNAPPLQIDGVLEGAETRDKSKTGEDLAIVLRELVYDEEAKAR